jgi:hypothetical protein
MDASRYLIVASFPNSLKGVQATMIPNGKKAEEAVLHFPLSGLGL